MGLSLPSSLSHGDGNVSRGACILSTGRIMISATFLLGIAGTTLAQTSPDPALQITMPATSTDATRAPVMDNGIYAHALLDQFEGRIGGGQNSFRWEGQGWIGTDYNKVWLKSEGFARGQGGVEDGRNEL